MFWKKKSYDFYVAGPMRGYPDLNKGMFAIVAHLLREQGFTVWSPSEHESYLKLSFAQCMTIDLNMVINNCRKIALLPGWRESLGANTEAFVAYSCDKEAFEVIPSDDKTTVSLNPVDLSVHRYPYCDDTSSFNPHNCELDSFKEN